MTIIVTLTIAVAPLHYYDFVIAAVLPFVVLSAGTWPMLAGMAGGGLILRADELGKFTGLYDHDVAIFEGSILSTIGGFLICIAVYSTMRAWAAAPRNAVP